MELQEAIDTEEFTPFSKSFSCIFLEILRKYGKQNTKAETSSFDDIGLGKMSFTFTKKTGIPPNKKHIISK
jgi:hypothetical protein